MASKTLPRSVAPPRRGRLRGKRGELARFSAVGVTAFALDAGGANLLWLLLGDDAGHLTGKALSATAATTYSYVANRHWTFRERPHRGPAREYALFMLLNAVAVGVSLLCLSFTVYVLGFDSMPAKNVSANVFGVALGTVFRYWTYQRWVFPAGPASATSDRQERNVDSHAHSGHRGSGVHRLPVRTRSAGR